jgi:hypothetical protein
VPLPIVNGKSNLVADKTDKLEIRFPEAKNRVSRERASSEKVPPPPGRKESQQRAASAGAENHGIEGHLRSMIRKAGERRTDLANELSIIERRMESRSDERDRDEVDDVENEVKSLRKELNDLSDLEHQVVELSLTVCGQSFSDRRAKDWWGFRGEAMKRIQAVKEENWKSLNTILKRRKERPRSTSFSGGAHLLEKVRLPTFSGKIEDWADFKSCFNELIQIGNYPALVQIAQLKCKLPTEAIDLITGLDTVDKVWSRLDERYGNKEITVVTALAKLLRTEVP